MRLATSTPPSPAHDLHITQLAPSQRALFDDLLALYRDAFPAAERKSPDRLRAMIERPDYSFWIAERHEQFAAFAIIMSSATSDLALLEYLAVRPDLQRLGIGRHLLHVLLCKLTAADRTVLIEAESDRRNSHQPGPDPLSDGPVSRTRRKLFYRSRGAREIAGLDYLMPSVSTGTPPPMDLLVVTPHPAHTVPRSTLHTWLTTLYTEVYDQPANDPRLSAMLANLPGQVPLV